MFPFPPSIVLLFLLLLPFPFPLLPFLTHFPSLNPFLHHPSIMFVSIQSPPWTHSASDYLVVVLAAAVLFAVAFKLLFHSVKGELRHLRQLQQLPHLHQLLHQLNHLHQLCIAALNYVVLRSRQFVAQPLVATPSVCGKSALVAGEDGPDHQPEEQEQVLEPTLEPALEPAPEPTLHPALEPTLQPLQPSLEQKQDVLGPLRHISKPQHACRNTRPATAFNTITQRQLQNQNDQPIYKVIPFPPRRQRAMLPAVLECKRRAGRPSEPPLNMAVCRVLANNMAKHWWSDAEFRFAREQWYSDPQKFAQLGQVGREAFLATYAEQTRRAVLEAQRAEAQRAYKETEMYWESVWAETISVTAGPDDGFWQ